MSLQISDAVKFDRELLATLKDRTTLCLSYVTDREDLRRLQLILDFKPIDNPTTRNIPSNKRTFIKCGKFEENGFPLDQVLVTKTATGSIYTQFVNQKAMETLNVSFVEPCQEVTKMLNRQKEAKAVSIRPQEANYNLSNTSIGAIATEQGCYELKRKQDEKVIETANKLKRKNDKNVKHLQNNIARARLKQKAIKYFLDNTSDTLRTTYCNIIKKKEVDEHILAFGGKLKDENDKYISVAALKIKMKELIITAMFNNEYDQTFNAEDEMLESGEESSPETNDDEQNNEINEMSESDEEI